jgi:hypothetical protein
VNLGLQLPNILTSFDSDIIVRISNLFVDMQKQKYAYTWLTECVIQPVRKWQQGAGYERPRAVLDI